MNVNVSVYAEWPPNVVPTGASPILAYQVQFDALAPVTVPATVDPVSGMVKSGLFPITDVQPHTLSIAATNQFVTGPPTVAKIQPDVPDAPSNVVVKVTATVSA